METPGARAPRGDSAGAIYNAKRASSSIGCAPVRRVLPRRRHRPWAPSDKPGCDRERFSRPPLGKPPLGPSPWGSRSLVAPPPRARPALRQMPGGPPHTLQACGKESCGQGRAAGPRASRCPPRRPARAGCTRTRARPASCRAPAPVPADPARRCGARARRPVVGRGADVSAAPSAPRALSPACGWSEAIRSRACSIAFSTSSALSAETTTSSFTSSSPEHVRPHLQVVVVVGLDLGRPS